MTALYGLIKSPCLTEKSNILQELNSTVVFKVRLDSNKIEIKKAIEKLFKVKVGKVRTTKVHGKRRRVGQKSTGRSSDWKKAYITLKEGEINFLDEL